MNASFFIIGFVIGILASAFISIIISATRNLTPEDKPETAYIRKWQITGKM